MIEIKLNFPTPEAAAQAMYRLSGLNDPHINAAVPLNEAQAAVAGAPAETADAAQKRTRRTKAEMEAARAAEAAAGQGAPTEEAAAAETQETAPLEPVASAAVVSEASGALETSASVTAAPKPSEEETQTKRREIARPALQAVMNAGGQDHARAFIEKFGCSLKEMPFERIDEFAASCAAEVDRLKTAKAA